MMGMARFLLVPVAEQSVGASRPPDRRGLAIGG